MQGADGVLCAVLCGGRDGGRQPSVRRRARGLLGLTVVGADGDVVLGVVGVLLEAAASREGG